MGITQQVKELSSDPFTLLEAYNKIDGAKTSIRARIYEAVDRGILIKLARGVYQNKEGLLIQGDGRDLSFISDKSMGSIITDHPYEMTLSNHGGNRDFSLYGCFRYNQHDFDEKARVLKDGHFLVEFLPEENADNYEYLYQIKAMAQKAGLNYYASVPWEKKGFVSNCGRKSKNTETVMIFSKGKARSLRIDAKKVKATGQPAYMSGANGMLPTVFSVAKSKNMIHQAEKPVELLEMIINYVTSPEDIVLDQFAGSGNVGKACMNTKRPFILIEIVEDVVLKIKENLKMEVFAI